MKFALVFTLMAVLFALPLQAQTPSAKKPEFIRIDDEEPAKKPKYYKFDEDEDEASKTPKTAEKEEPKEPQWGDLGGQSYSGVPRLIRQDAMTEVFFRDLKDSYVIHFDSKHNAFYKVFDEASRANKPVSFRADPVSRRIFVVDGVNGVRAPATNSNPSKKDGSK